MTDTPETDSEHQARSMGGFTLDFCRQLERERDDAIEMMNRTRDNSGKIIASQANENILLTEQRDGLAEACKTLMKVVGEPNSLIDDCWASEDEIDEAWNIGNEALQSLNQSIEQ